MVIKERPFYQHFDWLLVLAPIVLMAVGTVMIYNTTGTTEGFDTSNLLQDPTFRQILFAVAGLFALFFLSALDYNLYGTLQLPIYALIVGMLAIVIVNGRILHGAQRWILVGSTQLQPSEFAKLLLVLVLARFLSDHQLELNQWRTLFISLALVGLPSVLVYLEPDLGTTLILGFIWLVMVLAAGLNWRQLALLALIGLIVAPVVLLTLQPYQRDRLMTFMNPEADPLGSGYNVTQARIAIGSGGAWGLGVGSGTQSQLRFLRIRHTDFIFSVIGEELGFWGGVFLFAVFAFLILRLLRAATTAHSTYGRLIAVGYAGSLFFQSFVNLGMNLGLMPVTGIPLPFVSSGGSSLVTYLMMLGIVESILSQDKALSLRSSPFEKKKKPPKVNEYLSP